jgi:CDP-glucose 4,6-dehydratase
LGGQDPYSASKAATEILISSYRDSFFQRHPVRIASARSGNVIGGGDYAKNRIVPDAFRALRSGRGIPVRNPKSIRPWQHVLEPLAGYLETLNPLKNELGISSFNFGPAGKPVTVLEVVEIAKEYFSGLNFVFLGSASQDTLQLEATTLALNSSLATNQLDWHPVMSQEQAIRNTFQWWKDFFEKGEQPAKLCLSEIDLFLEKYYLRS